MNKINYKFYFIVKYFFIRFFMNNLVKHIKINLSIVDREFIDKYF